MSSGGDAKLFARVSLLQIISSSHKLPLLILATQSYSTIRTLQDVHCSILTTTGEGGRTAYGIGQWWQEGQKSFDQKDCT